MSKLGHILVMRFSKCSIVFTTRMIYAMMSIPRVLNDVDELSIEIITACTMYIYLTRISYTY